MDDIISRQAVKEWLERWEGYLDKDMIARMQYRVVDIPSADLSSYSDKLYALAYERGKADAQAEVIRCKDCKRYGKENCFIKIQMLWELKSDDYCSQAERKEDE